jgi:hypothetical protein
MPQYETRGNGMHPAGSNGPKVGERIDHLGDTAQQLISEARGAVSDFGQWLDVRGRMERSPYSTLAAAAGIGYVLGGGLFTPLTARVFRLASRLAALPFVRGELLGMAEAALGGSPGPGPGQPRPPQASYPNQDPSDGGL